MKSNYPWLKDWKDKAEKKSKFEVTRIALFGNPLGAQFTGYGEDGKLQPEKPTGMFQSQEGPVMTHEGEAQITYPDGTVEVIPANQLNQNELAKIENKTGMRGAQAGGVFKAAMSPTPTPPAKPVNVEAKPQVEAPDLTMETQNVTPGAITPQTMTATPLTPTLAPARPASLITGKEVPPAIPTPFEVPSALGKQTPFKTTPMAKTVPEVKPVATPTPLETMSGMAQPLGVQAKSKYATPTPTEPQKPTSPEYEQALLRMKKYAGGEDPFSKKIREEERMRLAGEEAAGMGALEQQMAQLGLTGREALTERAMLRREYGAQEVELLSALRKGESDRAFAAAMALPGATLAKMQHDLNKDQWQAQFDFENKKWEDMTEFEKEKWNWDKEAWQKDYDEKKLQFWAQFNLSKDQWEKMFEFSSNQWDYNKKNDFIKTLLSEGGPENFKIAQKMLNDMYGESIDFSNSITQEKQADFVSGMDFFSSLIASGLDWEEAEKQITDGGWLERMGLTETDAKQLFKKMKLGSNPLYQLFSQLDELVEQGIITQEQADQLEDLLGFNIDNPDQISIADKWVVYDKDGKEMKSFDSQVDAQKFLDENSGKGYTLGFKKDYVSIKPEEVEGTTITPLPWEGAQSGDVFMEGNSLYTINEKGEKVKLEEGEYTLPDTNTEGEIFDVNGKYYTLIKKKGFDGKDIWVGQEITGETLKDVDPWSQQGENYLNSDYDFARNTIAEKRISQLLSGKYIGSINKPIDDYTFGLLHDSPGKFGINKYNKLNHDGQGGIGELNLLKSGNTIVYGDHVLRFDGVLKQPASSKYPDQYLFYDVKTGRTIGIEFLRGNIETKYLPDDTIKNSEAFKNHPSGIEYIRP